MKWTLQPSIKVETTFYSMEMLADRPAMKVWDAQGQMMGEIFLLSSCHTTKGHDVSATISPWKIEKRENELLLSAEADSILWDKKIILLTLKEECIVYSMTVKGKGKLNDLELLSGYYTGSNLRWGNARFYSRFYGERLFNPEPDSWEQPFVSPQERSLIDMAGVPIPGREHWFFTPPAFCFVVQNGDTCMSLGLATMPGKHMFTEMEYTGGRGQGIVVRYEGYTEVDGEYVLPELHLIFGTDVYKVLGDFAEIERIENENVEAEWWKEPIFCGWGAQSAKAAEKNVATPMLACQTFYEEIDQALEEKKIEPGILVIDDKWQKHYGLNDIDCEKWPDMKGFIHSMHQKGRKVLLWLKAWDPEGVEPELCIQDAMGNPQSIDPENRAYIALFRECCHRLLASEEIGADGFKIDFTARIPVCSGCQKSGTHWGLELMRDYLTMVYDAAKAVKPDALVMCHCPHPYLNDKLDMIRLNDVNMSQPVCRQMLHRAKVVQAVMPNKLIDTDNWPMPNKAAWMNYVRLQPRLGIPSLYYLWHMDNSDEKITDRDLEEVRLAWKTWSNKQQ